MAQENKSSEELVRELYTAFSSFKTKMEDPDYKQLEYTLNELMKNQVEMRTEIKDLREQLLNPYHGAVVETKKNTEYINDLKKKEVEWANLLEEQRALSRWKTNVNRIGLAIITALGTIITFLLDKYLENQ